MGRSGSAQSVTHNDVLRVFETLHDLAAPLSATDVAEQLDCTRRTAYRKLDELLYELIDSDALTNLIQTDVSDTYEPAGCVTFARADCDVIVYRTGRMTVISDTNDRQVIRR